MIMKRMEHNYSVAQCVYTSTYKNMAQQFKIYLNSLPPNKIDEIENDFRANGNGLVLVRDAQSAVELFDSFDMFCYINGRLTYTDGNLFVPDGDAPFGIIGEKLNSKELFAKFFSTKSNAAVSSPFTAALLLFFMGKETIAKNFLTEMYKNLTVEVLSSENNSTLEFSALTDLWVEIGLKLLNVIFANHERIRLDMGKQEEEISKKYDFFDDDDDKKDFPDNISIKMEDDYPNDDNDGGDVLVEKESDNEMDDKEQSPTHLRKGKMILTIGKQFFTLLQEGKVKMETGNSSRN